MTTRQHSPCNTCELVGHCNDGDVFWRSGLQAIEPVAETMLVPSDPSKNSPGSVNEELAQVSVAALADTQQAGLPTS